MSRCPTCCCTIADYAACSDDLAVCPVLHGCPNGCHLSIFRRIGLRCRFCDRLVCLYATVTLAVSDDEVSPGYDLCEAVDFLVIQATPHLVDLLYGYLMTPSDSGLWNLSFPMKGTVQVKISWNLF
jgi:hypothetical protein